MRFLILPMAIASFLLASCGHTPPVAKPVSGSLPPVTARGEIAVASDKVRASSDKADAQSNVTAAKVEAVKKESAKLRVSLDQAVVETGRLKKQKSATEAELGDLLRVLEQASQRNNYLEQELTEAETSVNQEREMRRLANVAVVDLQFQSRQKDAEVLLLRNNLTVQADSIDTLQKSQAALAEDAAASRAKLAHVTGSRDTWRKIAIPACLALVLLLTLKIYTFFRL